MRKTVLSLALTAMILAGCGGNSDEITADRAKEIALEHAGLSAEKITFVRAERDRDDGRAVYDVEFYSENFTEYDYEIDAKTGEIVSYDADVEDFVPSSENNPPTQDTSAAPSTITEAQAKEIALAKVPGAADADIREFKLDRDDGRNEYEGKIIYNNTEYEFEINAENGDIIKWESESVFD